MRVTDRFERKTCESLVSTKDKRGKKKMNKPLHDEDEEVNSEDGKSQMSDLSGSDSSESGLLETNTDERSEEYDIEERNLRRRHSRACKAMSSGSYQTALEEFESILSDLLARYGEKHDRVGAALHNVAIANLRAGRLDDAMDAIEEAIKIRSRALGRAHPKVADSLVELGIILLSMEEHEDALKVFERALKLRREEREDVINMISMDETDESNLKIAKVLNNIGCVNFEKGSLEEALDAFDEAIELQSIVYRKWYTLVCGVENCSPGILTMASTMCNKGYVEIELGQFRNAVRVFSESLTVQKKVLGTGTGNKLVQSSLENLGYSYAMLGQYEDAYTAYNEVWMELMKTDNRKEEKCELLRKIIYCNARTENWSDCLAQLVLLEDLQTEIAGGLSFDHENQAMMKTTRKLMGEVNYQVLKLPSLSAATNAALGCNVCMGSEEEEVDLGAWGLQKPENTSKMSGHRVTHA